MRYPNKFPTFYEFMRTSGVDTPEICCLGFLPFLLFLLQKLKLLLKHVGRKLACCCKTSSSGKFRSHCSRDREAPGILNILIQDVEKPLLVSLQAYICLLRLLISLSTKYS